MVGSRTGRQSSERHDAALPLVVGPEHEQHVLDRYDPDQRPEYQRQDAQHAVMIDRHSIAPGKHLTQGV